MKIQHKRLVPRLLATSALAVTIGLSTLHASAQTSGFDTVEGEVQERFGNDFILESNGERLLVRNPGSTPLTISEGDTVTVTGHQHEGAIQAHHIADSEGLSLTAPATTPGMMRFERPTMAQGYPYQADTAALETQLQALGFGQIYHIEPKSSHVKVHTTASNGLPVEVKFEHNGSFREWHIKRPGHSRPRQGEWGTVPMVEINQRVQQQGYTNPRIVDGKGRHLEVMAHNSRGEAVELHVDYAGQVYREKRHYTLGFLN